MEIEDEFDDLVARRLVEIAGRLVGEQDFGVARDGARQRDALLLAAGKLTGIMRQPVAEPDKPRTSSARSKASSLPENSSGIATFSSAVMVGMRWKDWNTIPI